MNGVPCGVRFYFVFHFEYCGGIKKAVASTDMLRLNGKVIDNFRKQLKNTE